MYSEHPMTAHVFRYIKAEQCGGCPELSKPEDQNTYNIIGRVESFRSSGIAS